MREEKYHRLLQKPDRQRLILVGNEFVFALEGGHKPDLGCGSYRFVLHCDSFLFRAINVVALYKVQPDA